MLSLVDLIKLNMLDSEVAAYLWTLVEFRANILIAGSTSSGKTTLLNSIAQFIPPEAKVISIEDTRELQLYHENWIPATTRKGFFVGDKYYGEIDMYKLLSESFRQNPDYVIVGEVRGEETYVMFQGMASGHSALSTIHTDSWRALIRRLTTPPINLTPDHIALLDAVIFTMRARNISPSARRIREIVEVGNLNFYDIVLFSVSILFGIIVGFLTFIYFYIYPTLAKMDYIKDIEDNLPFFALYFYSYSGSQMSIINIFKLLNRERRFGAINKEISYLLILIDNFGYDILSALLELAQKTPSEKFKEFLYGLISVIRSGGSLKDFARIYAKQNLEEYEIQLKEYNEKVNLWITLYAFFFITFPMILLILAFLFSIASGNVNILNSLLFFFIVIIPFSYITYLYMIHIYQPKI
jgi:ABC-type multidrug transport system fused ATPase/permease subunit